MRNTADTMSLLLVPCVALPSFPVFSLVAEGCGEYYVHELSSLTDGSVMPGSHVLENREAVVISLR